MQKLQSVLSSLFVGLITVLTVFLLENSFIIPSLIVKNFSIVYFVILAAVLIAMMSYYSFANLKGTKSKRVIITSAIVIILTITTIITVASKPGNFSFLHSFEDGGSGVVSINISTDYRIRSILLTIITLLFLLIFLVVLPRQTYARKAFIVLAIIYVVACYALIAHSLITEWDIYRETFVLGLENRHGAPQGLFVNRNLFASYLFVGFIFVFYLRSIMKKRRWLVVPLALPLALIIFLTYSKTKIILVTLVVLAYFTIFIIRKWKKFWPWMIAVIILFIGVVTTVVLFRVLPSLSETGLSEFLYKLLPPELFNGTTFKARVNFWRVAWEIITSQPNKFFLGQGLYISRMLLGESSSFLGLHVPNSPWGNFHSGYIEVWANLGLIGMIFYLALIIYIIYIDIRIFKYDQRLGTFSLIALGAFLIHSSVESVSLLLFNAEGIIHALPVVVPQLVYYYRIKMAEAKTGGADVLANEARLV